MRGNRTVSRKLLDFWYCSHMKLLSVLLPLKSRDGKDRLCLSSGNARDFEARAGLQSVHMSWSQIAAKQKIPCSTCLLLLILRIFQTEVSQSGIVTVRVLAGTFGSRMLVHVCNSFSGRKLCGNKTLPRITDFKKYLTYLGQ